MLINIPLTFVLSILSLFNQLGIAGLIGLAALVLESLLNQWVIRLYQKLRKRELNFIDQRTKLISEYINSARILKYYGWDKLAIENVKKMRKKEI